MHELQVELQRTQGGVKAEDEAAQAEDEEAGVEDEEAEGLELRQRPHRQRRAGRGRDASPSPRDTVPEEEGRPSNLLKMLRPAPAARPLFLAAPGVANAQSAYFTFSSFLQVGR